MTPKEALNWCEQFTDNLVIIDVDTKRRTLGLQAMQTIKSALEKQIPKKPKIYNNIYPKDLYECPLCECGLRANASWKDNYCPKCGQKIDWSDTE